jgi:hypothetical protein
MSGSVGATERVAGSSNFRLLEQQGGRILHGEVSEKVLAEGREFISFQRESAFQNVEPSTYALILMGAFMIWF